MNNRHNDLLCIRPDIKKHQTFDNMSEEERFQNATLRPVLKLQNPLLLASFVNYANKHKGVFYELSLEKRLQYVETAICKDQKFRNALKGMLIGQFTVAEYKFYIQNSSKLNKRMMNLVIIRLQGQLQLLVADRLSKTI
ncbi:MAG: glyoxalase [Flavobacteriaceae bacterium]|nr:glyoxalase [Flavobacteriaceae bacterium]